jgi:hypothetical protein
MRFRSTLVITFLVPILDILASVGASPSGFRSRDEPMLGSPSLLDFESPVPGQVVQQGGQGEHRGNILVSL